MIPQLDVPNFLILLGGLFSAFAFGWGVGRTFKMVRQFFDLL